jgi:hypothetical protein
MSVVGPFFVLIALMNPLDPASVLFWSDSENPHNTIQECVVHGQYNEVPLALSAITDWKKDLPDEFMLYPIGWKCASESEIEKMQKGQGVAI